jgi:hypothetical protein
MAYVTIQMSSSLLDANGSTCTDRVPQGYKALLCVATNGTQASERKLITTPRLRVRTKTPVCIRYGCRTCSCRD